MSGVQWEIDRSEAYVNGLLDMASAVSKWIGRDSMRAYAFSTEKYLEEFVEFFRCRSLKLELDEISAPLGEVLADYFGREGDDAKVVEALVWYLEHRRTLGTLRRITQFADGGKLMDRLSGKNGWGPFFFITDIFFLEYESCTLCCLMGNNE